MIKFKWWAAWDNERFEAWLTGMAAQGYILTKSILAGTIHTFEKSEPVKMSYCVDFQFKLDSNYLSLVHDAGWKVIPCGFF